MALTATQVGASAAISRVQINATAFRTTPEEIMTHRGVPILACVELWHEAVSSDFDIAFEYPLGPDTSSQVRAEELAEKHLGKDCEGDEPSEYFLWHCALRHALQFEELTDEALDIIRLMLDRHWAANPDQAPATAPQSVVKASDEWTAKDAGFGHESEPEELLQIQGTTISAIIRSFATTEEREYVVSFRYQNGRGDYTLVHEKSLMPHLGYGPDSEDNWYAWVDAMWAILRNNTPSQEALELIETVLIGYWTANPDQAPAVAHQIDDDEVTLVSATRNELSPSSYEHKYVCDYNGGKYIFDFTVVHYGGEDDAVATSLQITHVTAGGASITYTDADLLGTAAKVDMDNYEWCELYSLLGEQLHAKSIRTFAAATIPALRLHKREVPDRQPTLSN